MKRWMTGALVALVLLVVLLVRVCVWAQGHAVRADALMSAKGATTAASHPLAPGTAGGNLVLLAVLLLCLGLTLTGTLVTQELIAKAHRR